jgi:hypothetical protein
MTMNQDQNQEQGPSGFYKIISTLGQILGVAAAILGTPLLFSMTKLPLYSYLRDARGRDIASILVWVMGAIEAYLIYVSVSLLFASTVPSGASPAFARKRPTVLKGGSVLLRAKWLIITLRPTTACALAGRAYVEDD